MNLKQRHRENDVDIPYRTFVYRVRKGMSLEQARDLPKQNIQKYDWTKAKSYRQDNVSDDIPRSVFKGRVKRNPEKDFESLSYPYFKIHKDKDGRVCTYCGAYKKWNEFTKNYMRHARCNDCRDFISRKDK